MRSTTCTEAIALLAAACLAFGAQAAVANGAPSAAQTAADLTGSLPRELAPGIMALEAVPEAEELVLALVVAADLALPSAEGFALMACTEAPIAAFVAGGGAVRLVARGRTLASVTRCPEAP